MPGPGPPDLTAWTSALGRHPFELKIGTRFTVSISCMIEPLITGSAAERRRLRWLYPIDCPVARFVRSAASLARRCCGRSIGAAEENCNHRHCGHHAFAHSKFCRSTADGVRVGWRLAPSRCRRGLALRRPVSRRRPDARPSETLWHADFAHDRRHPHSGRSKLAVDGVLIIGEHGKYPRNSKGQTLYPRYQFFKEVVKVFESSGRSVPVFNDKHLSTEWAQCVEMVADSRRLHFPFLAGSSLPVTRRFPAIEIPLETPLAESLCVGYGGPDSYDFHGLETAQCMSECRRGGEVGIERVHAVRGDKIWELLAGREITQKLLVAALARSSTLPVENGYLTDPVSIDWARKMIPESLAYFIDHRDGFKTTLFLMPLSDFNYAGFNGKTGEIVSCQMNLPMPKLSATAANFFNPLIRHIEQMIVDNKAPYPVERTLLTSGMTMAAMDSLSQGERLVQTPQMEVRYKAPAGPLFWRT